MTRAPRCFASWIAKLATPPAPPCTRIDSPAWSPSVSSRQVTAVRPVSATAAHSRWERASGFLATIDPGIATRSAYAPSRLASHTPNTASPTRRSFTPSPNALTTPEKSRPGTYGNLVIGAYRPARTCQSAAFTLAACTSTSTSPGAAMGSGTSPYCSTSGPPVCMENAAFIPPPIPRRPRSVPRWRDMGGRARRNERRPRSRSWAPCASRAAPAHLLIVVDPAISCGGHMVRMLRLLLSVSISAACVTPASAQWARVTAVPAKDVHSITANGDTLAATQDSVVYVSTNAGATWKRSALVAPNLNFVSTALVHNGRLYAGTDRSGVFVSDDLGSTWSGFSQGIAGLGALDIVNVMLFNGSLYAATVGGGAWTRSLGAGTWTHFGNQLEAFSAGNMQFITSGGSRLFATGGFNGTVFFRDPGQPDWTVSLLFNDHFAPGLAPLTAIWTGTRWVVASNIGIFHSTSGQEPWAFVDYGFISPILFSG